MVIAQSILILKKYKGLKLFWLELCGNFQEIQGVVKPKSRLMINTTVVNIMIKKIVVI